MKIAGNDEFSFKKWLSDNKKAIAIAIAVILLVVGGLVALGSIGGSGPFGFIAESGGKYEDNRDEEQEMSKTDVEPTAEPDESEVEDEDADENPGKTEARSSSGGTVRSVMGYTGIDTTTDKLVELVKQTVKHANEHINENLSREVVGDHVSGALAAIKWAKGAGVDMNSGFADESGSKKPIQYDGQPNENLTYNNVAGSMGTDIFDNQPMGQFRTDSTMLMNMIVNSIYEFDVNAMSGFWVDPSNNRKFVDGMEIQWDVNFGVNFNYGGQHYEALIGNRNGEYVVLDIIKGGDASSTIVNSAPPVDQGKTPTGPSGNMGHGTDGFEDNVIIDGSNNGGTGGTNPNPGGNGGDTGNDGWMPELPPPQPAVDGGGVVVESGEKLPGAGM